MFKKLVGGLTSTAVVAGMVAAGVVATATPAAAAPVPIPQITSSISDNFGTDSDGTSTITNIQNPSACLTYAPITNGLPESTDWVTAGSEAKAGHGYGTSGSCPKPNLITDKTNPNAQSVIGFEPSGVTSAQTGTPFLLGTAQHYNNTITSAAGQWFKGKVNLRFNNTTFPFPYLLHETPNTGGPVDDVLTFTGQIADSITVGSFTYRLVAQGFLQGDDVFEGGKCKQTPPSGKTPDNKFVTEEWTTTKGCLYGVLTQVRPLTLVKKVEWDTGVTAPSSTGFGFKSTSDLAGSPWAANPGTLTPSPWGAGATATHEREVLATETVSITEDADPTNWKLTDIKCVDGMNNNVGTVSMQNRRATLTQVEEATTTSELPITCTFTNTYTRSMLQLRKTWVDGNQGDTAKLTITGGTGTDKVKTSTSNGQAGSWTDTTNVASAEVTWGSTVKVDEELNAPGNYVAGLTCTGGVTPNAQGQFTMPNNPVTCTYTNSRSGNQLQLRKTWVDGKKDDTAKLTITGGTGTDKVKTSTSNGQTGSWTDTTNVASAQVKAGDTVKVDEELNAPGNYVAGLTCTGGVTPNAQGQFTMPNNPVTCTYTNSRAAIHVAKTADPTLIHPGEDVTYTYVVTNTGAVPLSGVTLSDDPKCEPIKGPDKADPDNGDSLLDPGEVWTYTCTQSVDTTTTNVVTATGTAPNKKQVTDTDDATVKVINPKIEVDKSADPSGEIKAGTEVTYTYKVKNSGNTPLYNVSVTDVKCEPVFQSSDGNDDDVLDPDETWTYTCKTTITETTTNVVLVTAEDELGKKVDDQDTETVTVLKPGINLKKSSDKTVVAKGGKVTYTYTVTNKGDSALFNVTVTDDKCSPVEYKSGDTNEDKALDLEETWEFECTTTLNETTTNIAVASGEDGTGQKVKDQDTATVIVPKPGIKIVKAASATTVKVGESVTYTYTVTNTGDTPLLNVTVTDDKCSPVEYKSGDTNGDKALDLKETWTFTCTTALNVTTTNVAVVTGKDKTGQETTDKAQATVTVTQVSPIVAKQICPIDVTLHKPQPKKVGNKVMTDKIKTKKSSCVLLKPVVLCRPLASTAAGETAFCETKVTKKGRISVKTKGYKAVRVSVIVRTKPKPGFEDLWKPDTWRKSWKLK